MKQNYEKLLKQFGIPMPADNSTEEEIREAIFLFWDNQKDCRFKLSQD